MDWGHRAFRSLVLQSIGVFGVAFVRALGTRHLICVIYYYIEWMRDLGGFVRCYCLQVEPSYSRALRILGRD